jgi:putative nucleotidyltransferase with HDIG domain
MKSLPKKRRFAHRANRKTASKRAKQVLAIHDWLARDEEQAGRVHSLLTVIGHINKTVLRARSEAQLLGEICESLTQIESVRFVWIGLAEEGSFEVKPVAQAGFEEGSFPSVRVTWDDSEYGRGPTGKAIKTGKPFVTKDIETDPIYHAWGEQGLRRACASTIAVPLVHEGEVVGVLNVYSERKDAFGDEEVNFLTEVAGDIVIGIRALQLKKDLERSLEGLRRSLNETVQAITLMSEMRDPYTAGHQRRVAKLASAVAQQMGLPDKQVESIRMAGLLHDVGKTCIPAEILSKPGPITDREFAIVKTHPQASHEILKRIEFGWPVAEMVLQHHERLDGSGYPSGLSGEGITVEARILGVADVIEAMSSHRPYRPALSTGAALAEISQKKGVLYDPEVVDACLTLFRRKRFRFD